MRDGEFRQLNVDVPEQELEAATAGGAPEPTLHHKGHGQLRQAGEEEAEAVQTL